MMRVRINDLGGLHEVIEPFDEALVRIYKTEDPEFPYVVEVLKRKYTLKSFIGDRK